MKSDHNIPDLVKKRTYPSAAECPADSKKHVVSEQTRSPTYELAFADGGRLQRLE